MSNDPYSSENRFHLSAVCGNAFAATPSDTADLPVGVKAVDIENQGTGFQRVDLVPVNALPGSIDGQAASRAVSFFVPPGSVRPVPMRVQRVLAANIGANIRVICYTDGNVDSTI
jgi:hypothetical protein